MLKKDVKSPLLKKQNSIGLACTGIYTTALTVVSTMVVSYAASNDLGSKLKTAMQSFYNNMKDAFDTAAIAALAVALFFLLFGVIQVFALGLFGDNLKFTTLGICQYDGVINIDVRSRA